MHVGEQLRDKTYSLLLKNHFSAIKRLKLTSNLEYTL